MKVKHTSFDLTKIKETHQMALYNTSVMIMHNENNSYIQASQFFLIANTILLTAIAQLLTNDNTPTVQVLNNLELWRLISLVGVLYCFLWLGIYLRRWKYYEFRVAQVRQREPKEWNLIAGDGKDFSEGTGIYMESKNIYMFNLLENFAKTKVIFVVLIILLLVFYILIFWKL